MAPLSIYKASAGSGKTYALTLSYLRLLFRRPDSYRHILAVTFTNKAAGEMKERILHRLHNMAGLAPGGYNDDVDILAAETGLAPDEIVRQASVLLRRILNDYSAFSVGTIDRFFQSVIRAFTREIGIQPAYNLELDHRSVLDQALDELFAELAERPELEAWLIRYAEERIEEARSWNFRSEMEGLGMQLFRESFQELFPGGDLQSLERSRLEAGRLRLAALEKEAGETIREKGRIALEAIRSAGFEATHFKGAGGSPAMLFAKALEEGSLNFENKTPRYAMEDPDRWLKKNPEPGMAELVVHTLMPALTEIYAHQLILNTAALVKARYFTLGILADINQQVQEILKEKNLFLLSDSSRFLRGIIRSDQLPFIYEKTGTRFSHVMLDEFQDTSHFQYENFRPLLDNALAEGRHNLVVGDVKQSIYRWRNSDWEILASRLGQDFRHQEVSYNRLDRNFRSNEYIMRFNNTLFQLAPEYLSGILASDLEDAGRQREALEKVLSHFHEAYADAVQDFPGQTGDGKGFVHLQQAAEDEDRSFREQMLELLPAWIDEVLSSGARPGDIAILVRNKKDGIVIARRILKYAREKGEMQKYRLISSESLLLSQNDAVLLVVAAMRYLVDPEDQVNRLLLKQRTQILLDPAGVADPALLTRDYEPERILPADFVEGQKSLRQLPLFELTEALIDIFGLSDSPEDLPYLQAFQEMIIELGRRDAPGIHDFLSHWEQQGRKRGIRVSEQADAIRILTIHRAKGLEFKAVMIPFCDWELTTDPRKENILWCSSAGTVFSDIPILPVKYSSKLVHTLFSGAYYEEKMKGYLDNLNLLYVAMTRAMSMLYVGIPPAEEKKITSTGGLIAALLDTEPSVQPCLRQLNHYRREDCILIGTLPSFEKKEMEEDMWHFRSYASHSAMRSMKIRVREAGEKEGEEQRSGLEYGTLMHLLFSAIMEAGDLDRALESLLRNGSLARDEVEDFRSQARSFLEQEGVKDWFSSTAGKGIFSERDILSGDGSIVRPDRVIIEGDRVQVVDFKFGKVERPGYRAQVRAYMEQMRKMGYAGVEGYLWYARLGKIEKIGEA